MVAAAWRALWTGLEEVAVAVAVEKGLGLGLKLWLGLWLEAGFDFEGLTLGGWVEVWV